MYPANNYIKVNNSSKYNLNYGSLLNYNIEYINIIFIGLILLYVFFYPPFRVSSTPAYVPYRLTIEALVLICLLIKNQLINLGKIQVNLLWAVVLVILFGMFGSEALRNILSFFNKLLFFLLLIKVFQDDHKLMVAIKKAWIFIWFIISFSAVIAIAGYSIGLIPFYNYDYGEYSYKFFPLIGSIQYRQFGNYALQQYTGWAFEPAQLAYYFSLNVILAETIYNKNTGYKWFRLMNLIGGLLTFSASFYLFFLLYFIFLLL
ncbi:uncharacterized protein METZ01_LOCUS260217, partial [marine metagenome]